MSPDRVAWILVLGTAALGVLAFSSFARMPCLFLWNASGSVREGLYFVEPWARPHKGDLAAAFAPARARELAARRHYVPASVPLIKPVAATNGDLVCGLGPVIAINGRRAVTRLRTDPSGRAMTWWSGCETLRAGKVFLLASPPSSFDGRYFGVTSKIDILGRAVLLWDRWRGLPLGQRWRSSLLRCRLQE